MPAPQHRDGVAGAFEGERGERELVGELDDAAALFLGRVLPREAGDEGGLGEARDRVAHRCVHLAARLAAELLLVVGQMDRTAELLDDAIDAVERGEVVRDGVVKVEQVADELRQAELARGEFRVAARDHRLARDAPSRRLVDDRGTGRDTGGGAELLEHARREGVIGTHVWDVEAIGELLGEQGRPPGLVGRERAAFGGVAKPFDERVDPARDAFAEFTGGLAREGEPEHLVGFDEAVRDEPDHSIRHRLGLPAAGPGHHQCAASEGVLDHRPLLGGGGEGRLGGHGQDLGDARGGEHGGLAVRGHRVVTVHARLTAGMMCSRHSPGWCGSEQWCSTRAVNSPEAMMSATSTTRCCSSSVASAVMGCCTRSM